MFANLFDGDEDLEPSSGVGTSSTYKPKISKPPVKRSISRFAGLENQGATCYLNSLIQALYMTPELRHGLFKIDPVNLGVLQYSVVSLTFLHMILIVVIQY